MERMFSQSLVCQRIRLYSMRGNESGPSRLNPVDIHSHRVVTRLVQVRHHREKSQRDLAAAIGMTQSAIWAIESGRRPLRLSEAVAICAALEVDLGAVVAEAPLVLLEETVFD